MRKKLIRESTLPMDATIKPNPISYNLDEAKPTGVRAKQGNAKKFEVSKAVYHKDFYTYLQPSETKDYVYIPRKYDPFVNETVN